MLKFVLISSSEVISQQQRPLLHYEVDRAEVECAQTCPDIDSHMIFTAINDEEMDGQVNIEGNGDP